MIDTLISSKTRIKLLLKFFLNSDNSSYLRALESEFGESTNAIRLELNRLEKAGMLSSRLQGNKKYFSANRSHPLFREVHNIVLKHVGLDRIVDTVVERLGNVQKVYVIGQFAQGRNCEIVDLLFVGDVDTTYLMRLIKKAENLIHRKIRFLIYAPSDYAVIDWQQLGNHKLLLWQKEG